MRYYLMALVGLFLTGCGCEPGTAIHGCEDMFTTGGWLFLPLLGLLFLIAVAVMFMNPKPKRITRDEFERRRKVLGLKGRD